MKRLLFALALIAAPLCITDTSNAQPAPPPDAATTAPAQPAPAATTGTPAPEAPAAQPAAPTEEPADPVEVISGIGKVVEDWKNLGWLAGVIALINLLLNILRLRPLNDWLEDKEWKWVKPLAACILGGVLGGFSTFQTGAPILNSIVAGFLAALGSVGFHELMDKLRKRNAAIKPKPAEG